MANRQLAQRSVTDIVLPDEHKADMWKAGADLATGALNIKMKLDAAKMNDFIADANLQAMKVTNDWRVANEGNPFDETAVRNLNDQYSQIFRQYEGKVGFLSKGQWQQTSSKMTKQWQADNFKWGVQREIKNAELSINSSIKKDMSFYQSLGQTGDMDKALSSARDRLAELQSTVSGVIGDESFKRLTKDYEADAIKSFIVGKAETDPDGALALLENEKVTEKIGSVDNVKLLKSYANKQKTEQKRAVRATETAQYIRVRDLILDNQPLTFTDIDNMVDNKNDAHKLKQFLVQVDSEKSNPIKVARYLDKLKDLPIDTKAEADAIYDAVMNDPTLSLSDKKTILMTAIIMGDKKTGNLSLTDMKFGNINFEPKQNIFQKWGWIKKSFNNDTDAIEAFQQFQSSISEQDDPYTIMQKSERAISQVAIKNNPGLSALPQDWTEIKDAFGGITMARLTVDGIIERKNIEYEIESDLEEEDIE